MNETEDEMKNIDPLELEASGPLEGSYSHNFGWALEQLKNGKKVQRKGWNGKGMFLTLQEGSTVNGELMRNKPAKEFYGSQEVRICPHIDMKAADNSYVVGWLASQTDMLADDWQLA